MLFAKVEGQSKEEFSANTYGHCGNCGFIVSRSHYGRDDECPNCEVFLIWDDEQEDDLK